MATIDDFQVPWAIMRKPEPWIGAGPGGREGEITFLVALNDLPSFVQTMAGTTETIDIGGGSTIERIVPLVHPDDPQLVALSYRAEAFGSPKGTGASVHSTQFSHYRVRVQFATLPYADSGETAYYTLTTDTAEAFETIPNLKLNFSDGSSVTGEFGVPTAPTAIVLTTFLSVTPVTFALASLVGRINSVAFDDFPQYTLRFTGVRSDYSRGAYTRTLVKSYNLLFRDPHWNKILRADGVWDTATLGTSGVGRFLTTDLNALKFM